MKKTKGWLHSPWVIGIGTTTIGFLLTLFYDLYQKNRLFSAISSILSFTSDVFLSIMNFEIKTWWLLVSVILIIFLLYIVDASKTSVPDNAKFLKYTQDTINGWRWKWSWEKNSYGEYNLEHLYPVCQICETPLINDSTYSGAVKCPRCAQSTRRNLPDMTPIKTLIIDNANRGFYPKDEVAKQK